jgi:hypothetical protein
MGNTSLGEYHHFLRGPSANPSCEEETRKMSVGFHLGSSGKNVFLPSSQALMRLPGYMPTGPVRPKGVFNSEECFTDIHIFRLWSMNVIFHSGAL